MRKDVSDPERVTNDPSDNWCPHSSPDGKSLLYLSYASGTGGHPRNKHVQLQKFSLNNGSSPKSFSLYGEQGTKISQLEQERDASCFCGCSAISLSFANSL